MHSLQTTRCFPTSYLSKFILCAVIVSALALAGCRFEFPNAGEGQYLVDRGVFSDSVPAWVNQSESETPAAANTGIVPGAYSAPGAIRSSRAAAPTGITAVQEMEKERKAEDAEKDVEETSRDEEEQSPLVRIEEQCPGVESDVSDALRTEGLGERIRKYERLTVRCPTSADLWLWIGKDYQSAGRLAEASRSFENVIVHDPSNEAARTLLSVVTEQLNRGASTSLQ